MDIDLLAKLIREIALEHDEISLPEVGTFVAELSPAVFSDKGFSITPPYRKLSFRQRLSSDNLIAEAYAGTVGISVEQASADLVEFLKGLKEILVVRKSIIFPGLGKMRATRENVFFFVPDADLDIYPDGYGLTPVSLRTHGGETAEVPATSPEALAQTSPETPAGQTTAPVVQQPEPSDSKADFEADSKPADTSEVKSGMSSGLKLFFIILCIAIALVGVLALLGRVAPELVDKILYSPEDYQLLHR